MTKVPVWWFHGTDLNDDGAGPTLDRATNGYTQP